MPVNRQLAILQPRLYTQKILPLYFFRLKVVKRRLAWAQPGFQQRLDLFSQPNAQAPCHRVTSSTYGNFNDLIHVWDVSFMP